MTDKEVIEEAAAAGLTPEEVAKAWEDYVRGEVTTLLDIFLPESVSGNVGVVYQRPIKAIDVKTGKQVIDGNKATAVDIHIVFEFPEPIEFFDDKPSE
jgi:hypothetical protein